MEAVSRGAAEAGGRVVGVTARSFPSRANRWVQEEIVVETWRDRLFRLIELGRGYVALPGGTGTLAEIAVVSEMLNKGQLAPRPLVLLGEFWKPMITLIQTVEATTTLAQFAPDPAAACQCLREWASKALPKS